MTKSVVILLIVASVVLIVVLAAVFFRSDGETRFGRFEGQVTSRWLDDGRNMELVDDFAYVDQNQKRWLASKGAVVNGASIPQAFWSVIGGPLEGKFRNASVIHDVECESMREPWQDVHRMFYNACRCGGVSEQKAKLMYYAVYRFGPKWKPVFETRIEGDKTVTVQRAVRESAVRPSDQDVARAVEFFESNNPSLETLESLELK